MSKHNDKFRRQRLGDNRWIQKYAMGEIIFEDEDSQEPEHGDDNGGENNQRDGFLDDFQLDQVERASVDYRAYAVGGDHEKVLNQRDAPRQQDDENQWPVL